MGDGEAETGPCATSWHSNKFLNPARDGAVLPILHLNGYKIAGPTVLARIPHAELEALFTGYGYKCYFVEGHEPEAMHQKMAATMDTVIQEIQAIQKDARTNGFKQRPAWPMIILRSPKGWTGPKELDGKPVEGTFRAHQVPLDAPATRPDELKMLEQWMRSYRPEELFDEHGKLLAEYADLAPKGDRRMGANPHANGGILLKDLVLPDFCDYAVDVPKPGIIESEATRVMGSFIRDVMRLNTESKNFRIVSPDETASNRWNAVFDVTNRESTAEIIPIDDHVAPDGRVMEVLSEHMCQGWLEGYLLTGRHGFFSCYEAFVHIIDSMFNQHAKWLKVTRKIAWRRPIASLNYLLSFPRLAAGPQRLQPSGPRIHRSRHQQEGRNRPRLSSAGRQHPALRNRSLPAQPQLRQRDRRRQAARAPMAQHGPGHSPLHRRSRHLGVRQQRSAATEPDVVMGCAGDIPTLETLAAVDWLRHNIPDLKIRVVNVVDLMTLQPPSEHPHGLPDKEYDSLFTKDRPIIFNYHGYPWLIHRLTYRRTNQQLHVRGYKEEGTTTTPFDMCVLNEIDRFHLAIDVIDRVPKLANVSAHLRQTLRDKLTDHWRYVRAHGEDMPEVREWRWPAE